jgi:uncharacterized protein YdaU (DUF1376 family)
MSKGTPLPMLCWWPRDYLSATRAFTLAERGAYTDLLFYAWDMGELPDDPSRLARMLGISVQEFEAVWPAIRHKFAVTASGGIVNERMERERERAIKKSTSASAKATKAASARWNAPSNAPSTKPDDFESKPMLQAMLEQCPPDPAPDPDSDPKPTPLEGDARGNLCVTEKSGDDGGTPKPKFAEVEVTVEQKEIAATMIVEGKPLTTITRMCRIPMAEVQRLRKELGARARPASTGAT